MTELVEEYLRPPGLAVLSETSGSVTQALTDCHLYNCFYWSGGSGCMGCNPIGLPYTEATFQNFGKAVIVGS